MCAWKRETHEFSIFCGSEVKQSSEFQILLLSVVGLSVLWRWVSKTKHEKLEPHWIDFHQCLSINNHLNKERQTPKCVLSEKDFDC